MDRGRRRYSLLEGMKMATKKDRKRAKAMPKASMKTTKGET